MCNTEKLFVPESGHYARVCVGSRPKRFLMVMRWRENLSSGEKRAG